MADGCIPCNGGPARIVRRNRANLQIHLMVDGESVANLAAAIAVRFVALNEAGGIALDKDLASGITVDDPDTGYLTVALTSADTDLVPGQYNVAVQVTWGALDSLEWTFSSPLFIMRDVIE